MKEKHIKQLRDILYNALDRCENCGGERSCEQCELDKAEFAAAIADILAVTESNPEMRLLKALSSV